MIIRAHKPVLRIGRVEARNRREGTAGQVESNVIGVAEVWSIKQVERLEEKNRLEPLIDREVVADPEVHADLRGQSVGIAREAGNAVGKAITIVVWIADRKSTRLNSSHGYISYAVF